MRRRTNKLCFIETQLNKTIYFNHKSYTDSLQSQSIEKARFRSETMNSSEYQVTIKSANHKVDDYVTKCNPIWTVQRLKQHISETHVNKPRVEDQRLIYAGNLLKDSFTLKQIFFRDSLCTELTNSNKTEFTIHLVCHTHQQRSSSGFIASGSNAQATSSTRTVTSASSNILSASTTSTQANTNQTHASNTSNTPRPTLIQATANINNPMNSPDNRIPAGQQATLDAAQQAEMVQNLMQSDQMRQQMAIFQQLACIVAAQIANNVANNRNNSNTGAINDGASQAPNLIPLINGQTLNVQITTSPNNNHIATTAAQMLYAGNRQQTHFVSANAHEARAGVHQNDNINNENNANGAGVGEPAAQFGVGAQMQAPAAVVDQPAPQPDQEVPIMQHDVIDWVYYSIRAAVLMAALYIHASMFRLLFIVGLLAIAYFFNRRRVPARQEPQPRPQEPQVVAPQGVAQDDGDLRRRDNNRGGEQQNVGDNNNNEIGGNIQDRVQTVVPGRVPFLKLCCLVITDFLASLVPE